MAENLAQIGVAGMGVMGLNLALNLADHGFKVAIWDRHPEKTQELLGKNARADLRGEPELEGFVRSLARPRRILLMVTAGAAVDSMLERLAPLMEPGDIVLDGGNSFFEDT